MDRRLHEDKREGLYPKELEKFAYPDGGEHLPVTKTLRGPDKALVKQKSFSVWRAALWAFLLADTCIVVLTLIEVVGGPSVIGK